MPMTENSTHQVRFVSLTDGTTPMIEIPPMLPQGGVTLNNQFVLRPLSTTQKAEVKIIASQAVKIGRGYADAHSLYVTIFPSPFDQGLAG